MMLTMGYEGSDINQKIDKYFGSLRDIKFVESGGVVARSMPQVVADGVLEISSSAYGQQITDKNDALDQLLRFRMVKDYGYTQRGNESRELRKREQEVLAEIRMNLYLRESLANDPRLDDLLYAGELGLDVMNGLIKNASGFLQIEGAVSPDIGNLSSSEFDRASSARRCSSLPAVAMNSTDSSTTCCSQTAYYQGWSTTSGLSLTNRV